MTTKTTLPRLIRNTRRPNADELVRVIPPTLAELVAKNPAAKQHETVAAAYSDGRTKVASLVAQHEQALVDDEREERAAIVAARAAKAPKAPKIADELERARRQLDAAGDLLIETSRELLAASASHVRQALAEATESEERLLDDADAHLAAAIAAFEQAGRAAAERNWLAQLSERGEVAPFEGARGTPYNAYRETKGARDRLTYDREKRARLVDELAHEREALDSVHVAGVARKLKPPPGVEVWELPDESRAPVREPAA